MLKFGRLTAALAAAAVGTLSSRIVTREKTALISRNGTSTTIRFRKVVMSSSGTSFDRLL
jgi:hypothetical protein